MTDTRADVLRAWLETQERAFAGVGISDTGTVFRAVLIHMDTLAALPAQQASARLDVEALIDVTTERVLRVAALGGSMAARAIREIIHEAHAALARVPAPAVSVPAPAVSVKATCSTCRHWDADPEAIEDGECLNGDSTIYRLRVAVGREPWATKWGCSRYAALQRAREGA